MLLNVVGCTFIRMAIIFLKKKEKEVLGIPWQSSG